jgi:hypothetical protein
VNNKLSHRYDFETHKINGGAYTRTITICFRGTHNNKQARPCPCPIITDIMQEGAHTHQQSDLTHTQKSITHLNHLCHGQRLVRTNRFGSTHTITKLAHLLSLKTTQVAVDRNWKLKQKHNSPHLLGHCRRIPIEADSR